MKVRYQVAVIGGGVVEAIGIETSQLVTPDEIAAMNPLLDMTGIKGGLHDAAEGYLDLNGTTHAYAKATQKRGADIILRKRVLAITLRTTGGFDIDTEQGRIFTRDRTAKLVSLWPYDSAGERIGL